MDSARLAEKANYWSTTVHPTKSLAEIAVRLEEFGATQYTTAQGQAKGRSAWLIRFEWMQQTYRFVFSPLTCEHPDKESAFGGKRRTHRDQARWQMGRIAVHFVKAILTAAEAHPHALFGFLELPEMGMHPGGVPVTAGELNVEGLTSLLPEIGAVAMLGDGNG